MLCLAASTERAYRDDRIFLIVTIVFLCETTAKEVSDPPMGRSSHNALVEQPF